MADVDRQTRDAFGNISGPMMPPRAEEAFIPTPKKEDVFGNTISKMSAESFSKAWEAATKAGTIDVNENDPRLLTAFKQANQYIADMAAAGLYTAQGGFEAAAGAIGEVFGGSPQSEMRFARDIAGMGEAFAGSGVSRGANLLDDLIESSVTAVKAATPGKLQADVVGQRRSLLDGDKEFRTESKKSAQGLSAQAVSKPESRIPFFKKKELRTDTNSPDAAFGTKRVRDLFKEDQLDAFEPFDVEEVPGLGDETGWDLSSEGYSFNKLGYARNIAIDSLARYKLGQIDLTELADQVGTDVTESFKEYVNARLNRLSNNPDFVDYTQKLERDLSFNPWDLVSKDTFDQGVGKTIFRSPIPEALGEMNWPNKGKEGYQILSELQKNPSVRKSELDTVISEIDPKKRYSLEEVQDLIKDNLWDTEVKVFSGFDTKWESYQRQRDLEDPETDYFELTIDSKRENKPNFKPRGQHFDESTLAHARASVRENSYTGKPYILGEEFQTDLIQKGYDPQQTAKPRVLPEEAIKNTAAARKEGGLFTDKADELLLQVLAEDYRYDLFYNSPAIKNFIEEVGPEKLLNKPGATTKDVLDSLSIYQASDLLNLYANYKTGKPGSINIVNNDDAWDVVYSFKDYYWNVLDKEINYDDIPATSLPPVKKIEETVKMTLGALISEAAKRNIDTIVIPPLERILEKRFFPGSDDFNNAMSPKSGFYKTYVKSVRSAIEDFEKEFGRNNISSRLIDMDYKDKNLPITGTEISFRGLLDSGYDLTKPRLAEGGLTPDVDRQTRDAFGNISGPMMPPRAEDASLPQEKGLSLEDIPGLERPLKAGPNDIVVGEDELGNLLYWNPSNNFKYVVKLNPDQRTARQKFEEDVVPKVKDYISDPTLPSGKQVLDSGKNVLTGAYDFLEGVVSGEGTYGDLIDSAAMVATGGLSSSVPEGALRIFGGKAANKADFSAYQTAKRLLSQKEKPQDVWEKTGWARNRKGELRFEIDDDEFQYFGVPTSQKYYYLDSVVQHPQLFENYPKLKDTLISEQLLEDEHLGYVDFTSDDPPRAFIVVNSNIPKEEKLNTILHELQHLVQSIEDPDFARKYEFNRTYFGYSNQPEEVEAELPGKRRILPKEVRKKELPKFNKGGLTMDEQMNKLFAEGGVNTGNAKVDPVSGNEVPPGSMPREVRDDIDAKLSGGEYVVPADVLRYYGVAFFEKLRAKAKAGLQEMDADGRIGGGMPEEEDDFPFSVDELQTEEVGFAEGGMTTPTPSPTGTFNPSDWSFNGSFDGGGGMDQIQVKKYQDKDGNVVNVLFINGKPVVDVNALGYTEYKEETPVGTGEEVKAPEAPRESDRDRAPPEPPKERTPVDPAENYYNLSEADLLNPNYSTTFGKNAGTIAKAGTLLAGPGIGLGVGLINGFQEASNLADARARAIIAKERGFDTTELDKFIKDMEANASGFVKAADFVGLDGKNIVKNMQNDLGTYTPATGTAPQTGGSRSTSGGGSKTYGGGSGVATTPKESSADRDSGYTAPSASSGSSGAKIGYSSDVTKGATIAHSYTGDTKLGYSPSITEGKTAASTPTKASDYKPAATDISKGSTSSLNEDYGTVGSARGGRAKGGLVEKPQKVAKPKTRRKTKI